MAIHHFRYSDWDGTQSLPDFTADDLLENMADDLLRGGDPERALRNLMRRGFELPDGRRFEGMRRLLERMREYRQDTFSRYDPNGVIDRVREELENILRTERSEIDRRHDQSSSSPGETSDPSQSGSQSPSSQEQSGRQNAQQGERAQGQAGSQNSEQQAGDGQQSDGQQAGQGQQGSGQQQGAQQGSRQAPTGSGSQAGRGQSGQGAGSAPEGSEF